MEVMHVADQGLELKIERVQALSLFQLAERLVIASFEQREPPRVPEMCRR